ncbi:MAG: lysostaphin resistance A-like protein [Planktomarina sp.]
MSYEPHENMVAPARTYPQVWRFILGCAAAFGLYLLLSTLIVFIAIAIMGTAWVSPLANMSGYVSPYQTLFMLFTFAAMVIAVLVVAIAIHHRNPSTLLGGLSNATSSFLRAMRYLGPLILLFLAFSYLTEDLQPALPFNTWLLLLPLSITLLLIQVSAEELVFRGYLQSHLAAMGLPTILWMTIPAVLFGLGHYQPAQFGTLAPWFVVWAVVFGLLTADLTARTGNLGAAIAFHFANNFVAILLVGLHDHLGGLALFVYPFSSADTAEIAARLPTDFVAMIIMYLLVRIGVRA